MVDSSPLDRSPSELQHISMNTESKVLLHYIRPKIKEEHKACVVLIYTSRQSKLDKIAEERSSSNSI